MNIEPITPKELRAAVKFTTQMSRWRPVTTCTATITIHSSIKIDDNVIHGELSEQVKTELVEILRRRLYENNSRAVGEAIREVEMAAPYSREFYEALSKLRTASRYMEPQQKNSDSR